VVVSCSHQPVTKTHTLHSLTHSQQQFHSHHITHNLWWTLLGPQTPSWIWAKAVEGKGKEGGEGQTTWAKRYQPWCDRVQYWGVNIGRWVHCMVSREDRRSCSDVSAAHY